MGVWDGVGGGVCMWGGGGDEGRVRGVDVI